MAKILSPRTISVLPEIAAVLLAAVIGITVWLALAYRQEIAAVQHTLQVEKKLSQLLSTVQDAETGNRGFLLSGNDIYLQIYDKAVAEIESEFAALKILTADSAGFQRSLASLRPIVQSRFDLLQEGIDLRRGKGLDAAVRHIQTNRGHEVMLLVRAGIAQLEAVEAYTLRGRVAAAQRLIRTGSVAAAVGILLVVLSVAGWIWNQRRDARQLAAEMAERELAESKMRQMQKLEAVGQLTGGIAHDFNNMLTVIISGLSLIKRRLAAGNTDVVALADATMDGANRAATLTSRLMAFARQQPLQPQHIDANKLVGSMADMISRTLGEAIHLESVLAAGLWSTQADPPQLESALLNLCVNARDAMPGGGKLTIETANTHVDDHYASEHAVRAGQYVLIAVSDTGTGMAPDILAKAFEPFFTTKETGKGTGLGLSQVHGFIKQSGGHVQIYSEPGHGTAVKIYLPRLVEIPVAQRAAHEEKPLSAIINRNQVILVVEDDDQVRELTVSMLRELGYTVCQADGAATALRELHARPEIVLLFTDIVMPETNGRQLADQAVLRWPHLKVLFTTGFTRNAIVHGGVLDADVNFLAKPFTLDQLASKISAVLTGPVKERTVKTSANVNP